ncbi:MAG: hypothetical protein AMXMBFR84_07280 [Candidatus Hydrogenedentota bacterium]
MFAAIGRWFRALGYLFTGKIDSSRRGMDLNPHVIRAKYEDIIRAKTSQIHTYKQAMATLIAQQVQKMAKVKQLTDDVKHLENLKSGALAKAKKTVEELKAKGQPEETIKTHEDYLKCLSAFNDFSSTLNEKQERIAELEEDLGEYGKRISEHKLQLQSLLRDVDKLRSESADAVAEVITAKEEKEIAESIAGIAQDGTAEELQRLRQMRQEVKAEARVTRELAGTTTRAQEEEFIAYARQSEGSSEFDQLIGLAEKADTAAPEQAPAETERLPE